MDDVFASGHGRLPFLPARERGIYFVYRGRPDLFRANLISIPGSENAYRFAILGNADMVGQWLTLWGGSLGLYQVGVVFWEPEGYDLRLLFVEFCA